MTDWLINSEWWAKVWVPALIAGLTWLAATYKTKTDAGLARGAMLDKQQTDWIGVLKSEVVELKSDVDALDEKLSEMRRDVRRWEAIARAWWRHAHDLSHTLISRSFQARTVLEQHNKPVPDTWNSFPDLPPLEDILDLKKDDKPHA